MAQMPAVPSPNTVLYALINPFGPGLTGPPSGPEYEALYNSGFTTVVIYTLFVHSNGDFFYGTDDPPGAHVIVSNGTFNQNYAVLQDTISALKTGGPVQLVLLNIGTGNDSNAWTNIESLMATPAGPSAMQANIEALMQGIPALDGFAFDVEDAGITNKSAPGVMAQVAGFLTENGTNGKIVAFTPAPGATAPWVETMHLIQAQTGGPQPVLWWNYQSYGGAPLDGWVRGYAAGAGVPLSEAAKGIAAGLMPPLSKAGPSSVQTQFALWKEQFPALDSGFLFNNGVMAPWAPTGPSASAYAQAIVNGLGATGST